MTLYFFSFQIFHLGTVAEVEPEKRQKVPFDVPQQSKSNLYSIIKTQRKHFKFIFFRSIKYNKQLYEANV